MANKTISINLEIPDDYRWIACQPWGEWLAFKTRPKLVKEMGCKTYCWGLQKGEISLSDFGVEIKYPDISWQKSLKKI